MSHSARVKRALESGPIRHEPAKLGRRVWICAFCFQPGRLDTVVTNPNAPGREFKLHPGCEAEWHKLGLVGQMEHIKKAPR